MAPREAFSRARQAADNALELDGSLGEALRSRAQCKFLYDWDWAGAQADFQRSAEMQSGGESLSHINAELLLIVQGRIEDAIAESRRACEANALSIGPVAILAAVLYYARRYDDAIRTSREAIALDPSYGPAHWYLSLSLQATGQIQQAIQAAGSLRPHPHARAHLGWLYAIGGRRAEALAIADELKKLAPRTYVSPHSLAMLYAGLGDAREWTRAMEASVEERSGLLVFLKRAAWNDTMRKQPAFDEFAQRVGLP
jgi:tetratricopeptide (TPR) repeat protein